MSKEHNQGQFSHGSKELKLLLGLQKDWNTCMRRHNFLLFIVTSSQAMSYFLMTMLLRLQILICQIKPLTLQPVFIPPVYLGLLVIMPPSMLIELVNMSSFLQNEEVDNQYPNPKNLILFCVVGMQ